MERDLEFLYELGAIRLIPRQWHRFHMGNVGDLADHHFRVIWLSLIIAAREGGKIDTEKMMKMALVHDIAESRTGDADYLARQYVIRHEEQGLADMLDGTALQDEFIALYKEYEKRECLEAKIVKDADNIDVDLELREQASQGHKLPEDWREHRQSLMAKMYTKTGKAIKAAIEDSNPHDWHIKSPHNRLNGGDWKDNAKQS